MTKSRQVSLGLGVCFVLTVAFAAAQSSVATRPLNEVAVVVEGRAPAEVEAASVALLAAEVPGVLLAVEADVGQVIESGQVMARIDPVDLELALAREEARLEALDARAKQAGITLQRAKNLRKNEFTSEDDLLVRETEVAATLGDVNVQRAVVAEARRRLDKASVVAPFKGTVLRRYAQPGSLTSAGAQLFQFVQLGGESLVAWLDFEQSESLNSARELRFESQGERYSVALSDLSLALDAATRARRARFTFVDNKPLSGQSGTLIWRGSEVQVPANFVVQRDGELGMFIEQEGVAKFHKLPSAEEGRPASVDLPGATAVITRGRRSLRDGDRVTR